MVREENVYLETIYMQQKSSLLSGNARLGAEGGQIICSMDTR